MLSCCHKFYLANKKLVVLAYVVINVLWFQQENFTPNCNLKLLSLNVVLRVLVCCENVFSFRLSWKPNDIKH